MKQEKYFFISFLNYIWVDERGTKKIQKGREMYLSYLKELEKMTDEQILEYYEFVSEKTAENSIYEVVVWDKKNQ
ncbi:MAG TPA: hypothetical protein PL089_14505 [Ignavibacteria bacterium]|nr:hypothetical protein [Ignavibacteria bacterium]